MTRIKPAAGAFRNGEALFFGEHTAKVPAFTKESTLDLLHFYNSCWEMCH